jgi:hypothetical protein
VIPLDKKMKEVEVFSRTKAVEVVIEEIKTAELDNDDDVNSLGYLL